MSKCLIAMLLAVLLISVNVGAAQETTTAIDPALNAQMADLEAYTQNLRGLKAKFAIEHKFPTRQEVIDYLKATYAREFPPAEFAKLQRFYVALGLLPADTNLQDVYLSLLDSQVAGFYDPATKVMNVIPSSGDSVGSSLSFSEQVTYVHEFTHALQDQYFDLNKLEAPDVVAVPDRSLAVTSLVEGDATATMSVFAQDVEKRNPLAALGMLVEGLRAGNLSLPPGIPPILVSELLFPYDQGLNFVLALYNHGGYDAINAAFSDPPTTSEQILHPEKYIAGEGASDVVLNDASLALGTGWTDVWDSPLGEFYLRAHLATELSDEAAAAAAAGWSGDHFIIYANGNQLAWALRLGWDSFTDSKEFNDAYVQYGDKRFGGKPDASGCWQDTSGALCLLAIVQGPESYIVSAPTVAQAKALAGM